MVAEPGEGFKLHLIVEPLRFPHLTPFIFQEELIQLSV